MIQHKHVRLQTFQINPNKNKKSKYNQASKSKKDKRNKVENNNCYKIIVKKTLRILNVQRFDRYLKFLVDILITWAFTICQMAHSTTLMATFLISMDLMSLGAITTRTITMYQEKKINIFLNKETIKYKINNSKRAINTTKGIRKIQKNR